MYYWIENQLEQIAEHSQHFTENEEMIKTMSQGRLLQIEFLLYSDMITGYLTSKEINELKAYHKTVENIIF